MTVTLPPVPHTLYVRDGASVETVEDTTSTVATTTTDTRQGWPWWWLLVAFGVGMLLFGDAKGGKR